MEHRRRLIGGHNGHGQPHGWLREGVKRTILPGGEIYLGCILRPEAWPIGTRLPQAGPV